MSTPTTDPLLFLPNSECSGFEREMLLRIVTRRRLTPMVRQVWEAPGDGALHRPPPEWAEPLLGCVPGQTMAPWQDRWMACWLLGRMAVPPEDQSRAIRFLSEVIVEKVGGASEPLERISSWRGFARSARIGLVVALPVAVAATAGAMGVRSYDEPFNALVHLVGYWALASLVVAAVISPYMVPAGVLGDLRVREAAAIALGRIGTIECVPALAQGATGPHRRTRAAAAEALRRLLPLVPAPYPEHAADLSPGLVSLLRHPDDELVLAALDATKRAGHGSCLGAVERCAASGRSPAIRDRAAGLVPLLRARREQERQAARLLRPAEPDAASSLLRPTAVSLTQEELLLRPSSAEDDGALQ